MDSYDSHICLPPRKRLLAGLKRKSSNFDLPLPIHPISSDLYTKLRDLFNSTAASSHEEIIEALRSAALAALDIAARARATAMEKANVAENARASARMALASLDLIAKREGCLAKKQLKKKKKKHVPIKLLYKNNRSEEIKKANRESRDRFEEVIACSKSDILARGVKDREIDGGKNVKVKPERLLLSSIKDPSEAVAEDPKPLPMKIPSIWQCKKLKVSLHSSIPSAPKPSIMVEVD